MTLSSILSSVAQAARRVDRNPGEIRLVAVSKKQPLDRIKAALSEGHRIFGENRVQEAQAKWPSLRELYPDIEIHIVGPLQTNKVRQALELAQSIHSVDRPSLAEALARRIQEVGISPDLFVQVNTGEEPQKSGVLPKETDDFVADCHRLDLPIRGLMCIPPINEEPALHFSLLAKIAARNGLEWLSMGMSADFEVAIRLGATHVRVGSAVFGRRG
ncbi:MAG: YggS family pyridoxal phosphate-dependent enzyme [Aestuariivita sp.]|nr:YggS family pyridoxal phosphate-dependent enzyme [Aestuariivita sp.]MCY4345349.1 YggS family pyridoxal phosphate-dependent enzyme [Aestuariivita sp.]